MSAEVLRIITSYDQDSRNYYRATLFPSNEAQNGSCTSKSTIYCANIAAGFMVAQFTKYLRGLPVDKDINLNLVSMEMSVTS